MKKMALLLCLLIVAGTARAQFEKGKWIVNPSVTGLNLSYDTKMEKATFGFDVNGGAFLLDNVALLIRGGLGWNEGGAADTDVYYLGVGGRYYIEKVGVYLGANVNVDRYDFGKGRGEDTKFSFGMEAGYAFFVSKTVTLEPAVYWNVNGDRSKLGLKLGFGFYF